MLYLPYIDPDSISDHFEELLSGPPPSNSPQANTELDEIYVWRSVRTEEDINRIKMEENPMNLPLVFCGLFGEWFNERTLPNTFRFLRCAGANVCEVSERAKQVAPWKRLRPFQRDLGLEFLLQAEGFKTGALANANSYPSGHAAIGACLGRILATLMPQYGSEILERAKLIGEDRIIAGFHFRSDVEAGRKLGDFLASRLLQDPAVLSALQQENVTNETDGFTATRQPVTALASSPPTTARNVRAAGRATTSCSTAGIRKQRFSSSANVPATTKIFAAKRLSDAWVNCSTTAASETDAATPRKPDRALPLRMEVVPRARWGQRAYKRPQ